MIKFSSEGLVVDGDGWEGREKTAGHAVDQNSVKDGEREEKRDTERFPSLFFFPYL